MKHVRDARIGHGDDTGSCALPLANSTVQIYPPFWSQVDGRHLGYQLDLGAGDNHKAIVKNVARYSWAAQAGSIR